MAREILFKAKRIDNGEWVEGSLINAKNYTCILDNNTDDMYYPHLDGDLGTIDGKATPIIPDTICQYTGLTDKNGNKIWENDVVWYQFDGNSGDDTKAVIRHAKYSNGGNKDCYLGFYVDWQEIVQKRKDIGFWVYQRDIEVIGNIFDNPELLEGTPVNGYADQCGLMSAT